jgi:5,5'-dehydrodivanillate O-demethylase
MGDLMRRYWHPVSATVELDSAPVKAVRLLGESLVLFRDQGGGIGLLQEACPHRGASLAGGTTEDAGIRCPFHGRVYNARGESTDEPFGSLEGGVSESSRAKAYPVEELGGLIFAYMGPEPAPLLPRYVPIAREDALKQINGTSIACNWLQVMENLLDPCHVESLHGRYFEYVLRRKGGNQLAEFLGHYAPHPLKKFRFDLFEGGIVERHMCRSEEEVSWKHGSPTFFPTTTLAGSSSAESAAVYFVVPLDDTHTWLVVYLARRTDRPMAAAVPFIDVPGTDATGGFIIDTANGQDHMAVVTQGDIARRDLEFTAASDAGIVLYRHLLVEQMEEVQRGKDPMNVRRRSAKSGEQDYPIIGDL